MSSNENLEKEIPSDIDYSKINVMDKALSLQASKQANIDRLALPTDDAGYTLDAFGNPVHFKGDPQLSYARVKLPLRSEHIEEIKKCANDVVYFIENYVKIRTLDQGFIFPVLRPYQIRILENLVNERFILVMASRQVGKSAIMNLYTTWLVIFHPDKVVALCANKESMSKENLERVIDMYRSVPIWMKPGVLVCNKKSFSNEIGCKILSSATKGSAIRGHSVTNLLVDECVRGNTIVTVRDKRSGEVKQMKIEDLHKEFLLEE